MLIGEANQQNFVPSSTALGKTRAQAQNVHSKAFSNLGGKVKRGDHFDVVIGQFHADGLVVE